MLKIIDKFCWLFVIFAQYR